MREEYDFSKGKRGAVISSHGKTRIALYIDDEVLADFQERAEAAGTGYQTLINEVLEAYVQAPSEKPLTVGDLGA